jgi:hypothetical protein
MVKELVKVLILLYFTVALSFATYLSLDGNEWNAINHNKCN